MGTQQPWLAKEHDLQDVDALLCSAQAAIALSENFCASEKRPKRLEWLRAKLEYDLLWIIRDGGGLTGALILEQDLLARVAGIAYIVVAERMRGQRKIGPRLVHKAQTLANAGFLKAEVRNDNSRRLLERCGFQTQQGCSPSGHPILIWSQS